jgi:outer membrane biosynthesis protein TonB
MALLDTDHKKKSFTLTTVLVSALLLLLFYVGLAYLDPPEESGISVNFGTTDFGRGNRQPTEPIRSQPQEAEEIPEPVSEQPPLEEIVPEETEVAEAEPDSAPEEKVLTQESEESIRIKQQKEAERKAAEAKRKAEAEAARIAKAKADAERKRQAEQDAKKKQLDALMGGLNSSEGTATGSEGNDNRAGDKGKPEGNPYATSYYGSAGTGTGGSGYGLNGRSLVSRGKVQQDCNEEGRVVVKIVVDRNGKVTSATPGVKGTNNTAPCLMEPARKTAMMHRWNLDKNAPTRHIGCVVVHFKLGE